MRFVFVDGYNVVNSWDILKKEKSISLESARQKLIDILDNYGAINGCKVISVSYTHLDRIFAKLYNE